MPRLIVVEPSKNGAEHLTFNSLVLSSLLSHSNNSIYFAASKSHYEALGKPKTTFVSLPVVSIIRRRFISKVLTEAFSIAKAFFYAKKHGIQYAIVLSVFPPLLSWLGIISRIVGISTILILHGELEGLVDSSRRRFTSFGYWVERFFKTAGYRNINCLVLSEGIYRRLIRLHPSVEGFIDWANHPVAKPDDSQNIKRDFNFATVGVATEKKHGILFIKMANLSQSGYRVAHVGITESKLFDRFGEEINFFCKPNQHLNKDEFAGALKRVRCALFPYTQSSYQMAVSGAMLDAIACGCNVISLPNNFAQDLVMAGLPITIVDDFESLLHSSEDGALCNIPWQNFSADTFCEKLLNSFRH